MKKKPLIIGFVAILLMAGMTFANLYYGPVLKVAFEISEDHSDLLETAVNHGYDINYQLEAEGAVLLKNDQETLPLDSSHQSKINLFGSRADEFVYNANGSAAGNTMEVVSLKDALEKSGFEINDALYKHIEDYNDSTESVDSEVKEGNTDLKNFPINEMPQSAYTGDISWDNLKAYSNIAVVNIGRVAGEGQDIPKVGLGEKGDLSYLDLSQEERDLLAALKAHDFEVIVLINSSYAMPLGFIEDEGIDAALWIGGPGAEGALAVADILNGKVNPSGQLADTYAYDLKTAPSYYSADTFKYVTQNEETYKDIAGFTEYTEGIYVGYRWYETADAEYYWDQVDNANGQGYEGIVQYPFGYGLSYSTFTEEISNATEDSQSHTLTFEIDVTNTGQVAGKHAVQLYLETPYTEGGLEKSKVVLAGFNKTDILEPNTSQTLSVTVDLEDFASYDQTALDASGAYVLDQGDYQFYLGDNAHSWKTIDSSDSDHYYVTTLDSQLVFGADSPRTSDQVAASNAFQSDKASNALGSDENLSVKLSRGNHFENAQEVFDYHVNEVDIDGASFGSQVVEEGTPLYDALVTNNKAWDTYSGTETDTRVDQSSSLQFTDMYGIDYNDPQWDELLSALSIDDMKNLIGRGGWSTAEIESINKPKTTDIDGPFGLSNYIKTNLGEEQHCVSYTSEVVVASTFNLDLVKAYGEAVGGEANASGTAGWYAPGANIHRSPFGGRNAEYYSEDPFLSGLMCAAEVEGAQSKGLYVYLKHFAFNDLEANRTNLENVWIDEQTAREIYLKPFEMAIKNSHAKGVMVSYMWLNGTWIGANSSLMTDVLRTEWGFNGVAVTDNYCASWMNPTRAIMAGTDLILSASPRMVEDSVASSDEGILAMKEASHHILYAITSVQNDRQVPITPGFDLWRVVYLSVMTLMGLVVIVMLFFAFRGIKKKES